MNPATFHPDYRPIRPPPPPPSADPEALDDDYEQATEKATPASHSFLEPRGEGILFAVLCILSSLIIYCGVLLIRFLA
jgi:hypothetical protein